MDLLWDYWNYYYCYFFFGHQKSRRHFQRIYNMIKLKYNKKLYLPLPNTPASSLKNSLNIFFALSNDPNPSLDSEKLNVPKSLGKVELKLPVPN